jgi:hypothetical protein
LVGYAHSLTQWVFGGSVKATHNGTAMEWIFDTRFAQWSNAVTETYSLVDSKEAAVSNETNVEQAGPPYPLSPFQLNLSRLSLKPLAVT